MKRKRIVCVLLAGLILCSLAACGRTAVMAPQETPELQPAPTPEATPEVTPHPMDYLEGKLRVGMECSYPPHNWQESAPSEDNYPISNREGYYAAGYDVAWAKILADRLGLELVIVQMELDGLIEAIGQGYVNVIITGWTDPGIFQSVLCFSDLYKVPEYGLVVAEDSPYLHAMGIEDFHGLTVIGPKGTELDAAIDQIGHVRHLTAEDSTEMIRRLKECSVDAVIVDEYTADEILQADPGFRMVRFCPGEGFDTDNRGVCMGLRKTDTYLLGEVNRIIGEITLTERIELWTSAVQTMPWTLTTLPEDGPAENDTEE